jgi:diguanylate cyclase (GGDEF)-like protein
MMAKMLNTIWAAEVKADDVRRRAERAEAEAMTDALTELYNRRGWNQLMTAEEERCRRYGHPACVVSIDLDGLKERNDTQGHDAGDRLLIALSKVLRSATRAPDVVARVGGDEFSVLAVDCDHAGGELLVSRLNHMLAEAGIDASVGLAVRGNDSTLFDAWREADVRMYQDKRLRKCKSCGMDSGLVPGTPDVPNATVASA